MRFAPDGHPDKAPMDELQLFHQVEQVAKEPMVELWLFRQVQQAARVLMVE
ncbi:MULTISPECIES: hypothetical protein [Citrobacter freundii complex]|uniref:hypothetical protein n=1 Tax=Citrobacter freundii complex TaxID=1344959 RepID=UPI0013F4E9B9|nr:MULTISPECIES: hypothetical protein [Citrobacter freundii complex]MBJ8847155.1 hypothetical protein [Citrobacter braakii]MDE9608332.1 hypothetical protein [Citrobacter portucalensis]UQQ21488.1 hypothetical protein LY264_03310 [Citrobacter portucalensis]WFV18800.1 hypothetical protein NFJ22_03295 [Citrobacter braakii]